MFKQRSRPGEGNTPLYMQNIGYATPKGLVFASLWSENGPVQTLPILVWNRAFVSKGLRGVYERICRFNSK